MGAKRIVEQLLQEISFEPSHEPFKEGDIVLRNAPGQRYPDDAFRVVDYNGALHVSPLGGGPVWKIRHPSDFRKVRDTATSLRPAVFELGDDNEHEFAGFHTGRRWNGWAMPLFTKETADKIIAWISEWDEYKARYDEEKDAYVVQYADDEPDVFAAEVVDRKKLYPIGAGSWVWDIKENKPEES